MKWFPQLPKPIQYTKEEGGEWIKWDNRRRNQSFLAHSIVFDNGRAFDMVSGWRKDMRYDKKTGDRIK